MAASQKKFKTLTVALSIFLALILGEVALRIFLPQENEFRMWTPNLDFTFEPDSTAINGVHGNSHFTINNEGLRGSASAKILAIGGSTTIEMLLDNDETWTHFINAENAGKNGLNSFHHIDQMKVLLQQFPNTKTIIILMGINDLQLQLVRGEYTAGDSTERYNKAFPVIPRKYFPWYQRTGYWRLCGIIKRSIFPNPPKEMTLDKYGRVFIKHRKFRSACQQKIDTLPNWNNALNGYKNNINALIDLAKENQVALIFATQPVLWSSNNTKHQEEMMWLGGIGNFQENGGQYYTAKVLDESMKLFNQTLIKTASERGVKVIDLYSFLPKDESIFYDDCHFTELGAKRVAEVILVETQNFASSK
ncbi:MAG: GDSL-type esterase/lipase family protein [Bacteroidetes bacterium]|nr:GDSL-type esterase/lipase family protein [Bacteroidota bacterium]